MWWLACAGPREDPLPVSAALADPPWVDPAFLGAGVARAVVWFDRQLLPSGDGYSSFVARWEDAPRSAIRAHVIRALRDASAESWAEAEPHIDALVSSGVLARCKPHWIVNGFSCDLPLGDPAPLTEIPGVHYVFRVPAAPPPATLVAGPPDVADRPEAAPFADPATAQTYWNLERLHIPAVWRSGITGRGVVVALHDGGVALDLGAIAGTVWRNPGEIPRNGIDDEGDGYVDDVHGFAFDRGDAHIEYAEERPGRPIHASLVAATVAGRAVDGLVLGGAPDTRWMSIVAHEIEEPVEWALDHGADIYSMSFSIPDLGDYRAHWRKVLEHASCAGLFLVSGAGNFGDPRSDGYAEIPEQMRIPEDVPLAVLGVSGIGWNGQRPPFSSQGPVKWDTVHYREGIVEKPDLATVNFDVPALWPDGSVRPGRGNSFAAPHLSAILALMLEADPELTPWRARDVLIATALDVGEPGFDHEYGHGLVDAARAVSAVR